MTVAPPVTLMRLLMNWALRDRLAPELPVRVKASALPRKNTPVM